MWRAIDGRALGAGALVILVGGGLSSCDKKSENAPGAPASASAAPAPSASVAEAEPKSKCAALGCGEGNGSFFEKCKCQGKPGIEAPLSAKWLGKYGAFDKPEWEVENKSDKPIHWASATVYYYNGAGKQIETKVNKISYRNFSMNGSNFTLDAKQKKNLSFGWERKNAPNGIAAVEVVFDGWCYGKDGDKENELCVLIGSPPEVREQGG